VTYVLKYRVDRS